VSVQHDDKQRTGITHFPLESEQDNQERVPPRGHAKDGTQPELTPGTGPVKGRRLSRQHDAAEESPEPPEPGEGDASLTPKSAKGGKTSGSRAGMLASRKMPKGTR